MHKVVIVGAGPAGLTAAIYTARADLRPLVIEGFMAGGQPGGQLMTTSEVENFPGFPKGIMGPALIGQMREQAVRFGAEMLTEDVVAVELKSPPFRLKTTSREIEAEAVILATGASARLLDLPSVKTFWGKGVSACATCDGPMPMFRHQVIAVVGGGDTAMEEATFLTRFAAKVVLIHRRAEFRASRIMVERVRANPKIEIVTDAVVDEVFGDTMMQGLVIKNAKTGATRRLEARGLFMAIGHEPNTKFLAGQVRTDEKGYIVVRHPTSATSVEGVFACGDVIDPHYRQAISAAGTGCVAALDAERWLAARAAAS
ncbi:MAG: Thioredoxin reductase [Candidatus Ozemobacter sibiricus]|jgi:thioredoxin reductase (NADPH)|uniref:Thioredoxin reductase n=1 Tax=Candidatus Ozemobacter sibiricus TaxID=2268124 RepID=A0A367ZE05_9BACT|nr:MAG: Thioredoxin reductase [Candidatus Ozemobacter sibiricus]